MNSFFRLFLFTIAVLLLSVSASQAQIVGGGSAIIEIDVVLSPSRDVATFTVSGIAPKQILCTTLLDSTGTCVVSYSQLMETFDLEALPPGLYTVLVETKDQQGETSFLKE